MYMYKFSKSSGGRGKRRHVTIWQGFGDTVLLGMVWLLSLEVPNQELWSMGRGNMPTLRKDAVGHREAILEALPELYVCVCMYQRGLRAWLGWNFTLLE